VSPSVVHERRSRASFPSAYDRIQSDTVETIESAAFDLVPISTEAAAKAIRETPVDELRKRHKAKKRNPTGRKIGRDGCRESEITGAMDVSNFTVVDVRVTRSSTIASNDTLSQNLWDRVETGTDSARDGQTDSNSKIRPTTSIKQ
jgi:hypothetical protein